MNLGNTKKALNLFINVLDTTKTSSLAIEFPEKKPLLSRNDTEFFKRATPEECGISSKMIMDFMENAVGNGRIGLEGIMILRGNRVCYEASMGHWDDKMPKATFSQCKSIVSLAIGVLVTQGRIKLSERLIDIFPTETSAVAKIRMKNLTVKHLLNMTSCVAFNESEAMVCDNWVEEFMNSDIDGSVGVDFKYNSLNTYMLSAIIKKKCGFGLTELLNQTIFKELNITDYYWEKCPKGISIGGWGLYIRREDMAKIGLLVMQKGVWEGKRLISPKYIDQATKSHSVSGSDKGEFNYGYQIWCGKNSDSFLFNGMMGQNLIGFRDSGIMIISNCANVDTFQQNPYFELIQKYFARNFPPSIPENELDFAALCKQKESFKGILPTLSLIPHHNHERNLYDDLKAIDGLFFLPDSSSANSAGIFPLLMQILQGEYSTGLESISFESRENSLLMHFKERKAVHHIEIGFTAPINGSLSMNGNLFSVKALGKFSQDECDRGVLTIDIYFLETPFRKTLKFVLDKKEPFAIFTEAPGNLLAKNHKNLLNFLTPHGKKIESVLSRVDGDYLNLKLERAFNTAIPLVIKGE